MARGKAKVAGGPIEEPWALPDGWRWERLGDVAQINPTRSLDHLSDDSEVAFIPMAAVEAESGRIALTQTRRAEQVRQGFTRFRSGDVLFAKITPCMENGKIAVVPEIASDFGCGSTEFHVITPIEIEPRFLYFWLNRRNFRREAEFNMTGTAGQKRVPTQFMRDAPLPVPPLDIQRRVVARIDDLFADLNDGEALLARAHDDLTTWRKALLKAAITGDLTSDWRAANPAVKTGADLLARILDERRARWLAEPRNKGKRYSAPVASDVSSLALIPNGWTWTTVEIAGDVLLGRQRAPEHHAGEHMRPYLRVANVLEGRLDLRDVKEMNFIPSEFETFALQPGDVLLNEGQSPEFLGRPAIYSGEIAGCCFQKTLLRFRPTPAVLPEFALTVFRQYMHGGRFLRESRITTNIGHLTQVRFLPMEFPLPPLDEQCEIARLVNEAEAAWDDTALGVDLSGPLRQSILSAAFRGDLVA